MIVDLKSKKLVDCLKRILVCGRDANSAASRRRLERVGYCAFLGFHHRYPGGHFVMNEHRHLEIAFRKHLGDVGQMYPYFIPTGLVVLIVRVHLDYATTWKEQEMMGRRIM